MWQIGKQRKFARNASNAKLFKAAQIDTKRNWLVDKFEKLNFQEESEKNAKLWLTNACFEKRLSCAT